MDWSNERYVRLYTRETVDDALLSWEARALWHELLKRFDRAGVVEVGPHGWRGVAVLVRIPPEIVERAGAELEQDGRIERRGDYLLAPNFIEAQEATFSDRQRKAESRARRRDEARARDLGIVTKRDTLSGGDRTGQGDLCDAQETAQGIAQPEVTKRPAPVTNRDRESRNVPEPSRPVTGRHSDPCFALPCRTDLGDEHSGAPVGAQPLLVEVEKKPRFDFAKLYKLYPRKRNRARGLKAAAKAIRTEADYQAALTALVAMEKAWRHIPANHQEINFLPHFATWVTDRRWEDEHPLAPGESHPAPRLRAVGDDYEETPDL